MATTLRQTYSCIVRRKFLKEVITFVILSTMGPTSCLSWSIVMGLPIMEVRQVCRVTRLVATWKLAKLAFNFWLVLKYFGNTWEILRNIYLLVEFSRGPVGVSCSHPPLAVDGLVGGGGEHQQLVPLVGQQPRVNLDGNLGVEWKLPSPADQLQDNSVSNLTQLLWQVRCALIQQISDILRKNSWNKSDWQDFSSGHYPQCGNVFKVITVY